MKQREKCSGRGCESPQVHHKEISMNDNLTSLAVGVLIVFIVFALVLL